tara:strand:- start:157 stop:846 length:690 start_codon:yes stop_codon:yes gene_type:complete
MYDTIIIIPYRAREKHLKYFLDHTAPLLKKHIPNGKVVIIEQDWNNKLFNRGCLLNIGVKEYENKTNYFIFHDVDTIPEEKCIEELYTNNSFDVIRTWVTHNVSLGGICKFTHDCILEVNGLPNYIWGWGIEDRALFYRCVIMNKKISPNYSNTFNFKKLPHPFNGNNTHPDNYNGKNSISENENNIFKSNNYEKQIKHIMSSGLNNLKYKIVDRRQFNDYVEFIKVSI